METRGSSLNHLLVRMFNDILKIEEKALSIGEFKNLTVNEFHVLEAIGDGEGRNMSSISRDLDVTIGTLTIAVNNLVKKGYAVRRRSEVDRRVVLVTMTEKGLRAHKHHIAFHDEMIDEITEKLSPNDVEIFMSTLENINVYFHQKYLQGKEGKK